MMYEYQDLKYSGKTITGVLVGVLVGGIAGAVAMLLLAPQSGKETRVRLQKKGIELGNQTNKIMEGAVAKFRSNASKLL